MLSVGIAQATLKMVQSGVSGPKEDCLSMAKQHYGCECPKYRTTNWVNADNYDYPANLSKSLQVFYKLFGSFRIQAYGWLIQKQDIWIVNRINCARDTLSAAHG